MSHSEEVWVPVTLHLPIGFAKSWNPASCSPVSYMCGPYAIILLAQLGNTVLVPVLPFLVREMGYSRFAYGVLQSSMWMSQTILSPLLGALSDNLGRRAVIFVSLLISASGCLLLGLSSSFPLMLLARVITGSGFQIALFRAYFADTTSKEKRTGTFGLIGVTLNGALILGPLLGGFVSEFSAQYLGSSISLGGKRICALVACALFLIGALVCAVWTPDETTVESKMSRQASFTQASNVEKGSQASTSRAHGVKYVKVEVEMSTYSRLEQCGACGRVMHKFWLLLVYLAQFHVYPLLTLNFFFRFAFAAYKSNFPYMCEEALGYGPREVGIAVSAMGVGGMLVQGVMVRVINNRLGEHKTLVLAMGCTSIGYASLAIVSNTPSLVPSLTLISLGYGLAVPCISTLFSHVPVEQGVMQGIAGSIDRFGQVFGPVVGGLLLDYTGLPVLMMGTGGSLATISAICLSLILDSNSQISVGLDALCAICLCRPSDKSGTYSAVGQTVPEEEEEEDGISAPTQHSTKAMLRTADPVTEATAQASPKAARVGA